MKTREEMLEKMFKNLWKKNKYNQEYISFLLGSYTDEEFMDIACLYAEKWDKMDEKEVMVAIEILQTVLDKSITFPELAYILNMDCFEGLKKNENKT